MRLWRLRNSGSDWERPTGVSTASSALLAVLFLVWGLWTFPMRPGYVAADAMVQDDRTRGRYATTLVVELTVVDAPVRTELTVSRQLVAAFVPVPVRGDTVPVFRNGDGSSLRYAGPAAWVDSLQVFAIALAFTVVSLRAYRASRR
jgi:hypothetical protein